MSIYDQWAECKDEEYTAWTGDVVLAGNDEGREYRLCRVVGYLGATHPTGAQYPLGLYDHKGTLTAVWHRPPTEEERAWVDAAWDAECEAVSAHLVRRTHGLRIGAPSMDCPICEGHPGEWPVDPSWVTYCPCQEKK